ncbi:MAG: hemolysin D [Deltaproteobacteria bacterium HGW-Deltaproteobacteria-14]|nr:MAG: hemolysin D [Deltaproteobacteria bacterium HGW-Deltaproteobacteria-14]
MKRVIPVFILLVIGLSVVLYLELSAQNARADRASGGSATIEGTEVDVVAKLPARITALNVREGDRVKAGDTLVAFDCAEVDAAYAQADAAVKAAEAMATAARAQVDLASQGVEAAQAQTIAARAQADAVKSQRRAIRVQKDATERAATRVSTLADAGGASVQELDKVQSESRALSAQLSTVGASAEAVSRQADAVAQGEAAATIRVQAATAQVAAADAQKVAAEAARTRAGVTRAECTLTAPIDGYVSLRSFEPGELVMPGGRVLTLTAIDEVTATFYLPNAELEAAAPGRPVTVVADALPGESFAGTVRRVATEAEFTPRNVQTRDDRDRLVYAVEVEVPNPDGKLRPGMPVEITLPGTERK